jgi:hypothetical protein
MKGLIITTVLMVLGLAVIACAPRDTADSKSPPFYWESYNVDINIQDNGDMLVTEVMHYIFTEPHTNQRSRWIPMDKIERITDVSVTEQGEPILASSGLEGGNFRIRWSHPPVSPPKSRTFTLQYRVHGALHIDDKGDQVYWKALPKERSAPIKSGEVTVRLPDSLAGKVVEIKSFGVRAHSSQVGSRTVKFVTIEEVPSKSELEVQVTFPHGIIAVGREG